MWKMSEVAKKLKEVRARSGLSCAELDLRAGVKVGYSWALENGRIKRAPNPEYWSRLLNVLGVTEEELLSGTGTPTVHAEKPRAVRFEPAAFDEAMVPVLGVISAGPFRMFPNDEAPEMTRGMREDKGAFALRVKGDSMAPAFEDGDIVFLKPEDLHFPATKDKGQVPIQIAQNYHGRVCAILLEEGSSLKKIEVEKKTTGYLVHFVPFNKNYDPVTLKAGDDCHIKGFVYKLTRRVP